MAIDTTEASLQGVGRGSAFVWGENKALRGLQQAYEQDRLRKQKEEAELADQVSKINYDAARDSDLPEILKRYGSIKNTFAKIRGTQNSMDRIKLQSDLNQQKAELSRAVALSKQAAQQEGDLGKLPLTNPDNISDDFVSNYSRLRKLSVFDPEYQKQAEYLTATGVLPKYDHISVSKKLADASIQKLSESAVKTENLSGGNKSYYTESGQKLDKDALAQNVVLEAQRNKGLRNEIQKLYPDLDYTNAVKAYTDDLYDGMKGKYDEVKRTGASVIKPDNWKEKADYNHGLILARQREREAASGGNIQSTPTVRSFYTSADENGKTKKVFDVPNFVSVNPTPVGIPQTGRVYDIQQGKVINLPATASIEITGIGSVPTKDKQGNVRSELRVFVTDKDGGEYAIDERQVPVKTKNEKNYQRARQQALSTGVKPTHKTSTTTKKKIAGY